MWKGTMMENGGKYRMRGLSEKFMNDLSKPEGKLHPILERVKKDHSLMLAIRDGYINIYYRGGNILRVTEHQGFYQTFFDVNFAKSAQNVPNPEEDIFNQADAQKLFPASQNGKLLWTNTSQAEVRRRSGNFNSWWLGKITFRQSQMKVNTLYPISSSLCLTLPALILLLSAGLRETAKPEEDAEQH
jgi:hypothetical protein